MKPSFQKIIHVAVRFPRILGEHAFLFTMLLIVCAFIFIGSLFVFIVLPAEYTLAKNSLSVVRFREDTLEKVLNIWVDQEKRFKEKRALAPRAIFRYNPNASP